MSDLFATVGAIYEDGIGLIFDGQTEVSGKHYKCNSTSAFSVGQRVKLVKLFGTYLVEYPVGVRGNGTGGGTGNGGSAEAESAAAAAKKSAEAAAQSASAAENSAQRIESMTVTGESYDPGEPPVYNATEVAKTVNPDGTINLHFTVPRGPRGGDGYTYVPRIDETDGTITWDVGYVGDPDHGEMLTYKAIPQRGTDYWTKADQEAIVSEVLAQLPDGGNLPVAEGVDF